MFTAVLYTTAKTQKQPKCPQTEEWIKKMQYKKKKKEEEEEDVVYVYKAIKKNEIMPSAATWMDLEITYYVR